jgi:hypothetical protein
MDPNDAFQYALNRAYIDSRSGPQSSPIKVKWTCDDCGKRRAGREHNICMTCNSEICNWCQDKHLNQNDYT